MTGRVTSVRDFGAFVPYYLRLKRAEQQRFEAAENADDFQRREYFART